MTISIRQQADDSRALDDRRARQSGVQRGRNRSVASDNSVHAPGSVADDHRREAGPGHRVFRDVARRMVRARPPCRRDRRRVEAQAVSRCHHGARRTRGSIVAVVTAGAAAPDVGSNRRLDDLPPSRPACPCGTSLQWAGSCPGSAGTGKTVVALHRAPVLAKQPRCASPPAPLDIHRLPDTRS